MKKLFQAMSWVMLILSGCADEDIIERNSPSFPQSVNTRSAGDGVYDILGYGYDITGPYLDTKSSRAIVFDTNKLLEKGLITPYKLEESRFRYSSGKDVIDFTTNMSSSLQMSTPGILKVIGGASLNIAFGGNSHYNSDYSFAYCTQQYIDSRYRISEADINVLKTCLTKQFIERLSTYTPEQIVEEYGTHVLKDIYLGAKFEVYYMAKSTSSSKKESINAGLGASLFSLFKMDGKFQYDESLAITNKEQSLYYFTIGGDPAVGVQGSLNPENSPSIDIGKWMASVKSSTPKFIDVDNNSQSFIPIYELVTDPTKKQTLKAYIDNYIKSKEVCSISLYPSTTGTRQVSGLGHINQGAGVAIGDIDKNGRPDMILMGIDNPKGKNNFWYKVLYDIDENGYYSKESSILSISAEGWENSGGDIALCDLNNNGILDMVLLCTDKPTTAGRAYRWYYVAYDLKPDGHYNSLSSLNTLIETPILFSSALISPKDVVKGYEIGANNYIKKPFIPEELDAHVHALLKLSKGEKSKDTSQCYKIGKEYVLDATHATLKHASGVNKTLTVRETGLLQMLCEKRGDVIRREAILDKFWNTEDDYFASRSLDVFVTRLRKFLSEDESVTIKTVKGVGLILIEN